MSEYPTLSCHPDRWLVCSDILFASLRDGWCATEAPQSLMRLRFSKGLAAAVPLCDLVDRARSLAASMPAGTLHIVVERLDRPARAELERLADLEFDIVFHVWHEQPESVLHSLVTPERALLSSWQRLKRCPELRFSAVSPLGFVGQELYIQAVRHWETNAREDDGATFDATYGPQVVRLAFEVDPLRVSADASMREAHAAFASEPVPKRKSDLRRWRSPEPAPGALRLTVTLPGKFYDEVSMVLTAGQDFGPLDSLCGVDMTLRDITCELKGPFCVSNDEEMAHHLLLLDSREFQALRNLPWQDASEELVVTLHRIEVELV